MKKESKLMKVIPLLVGAGLCVLGGWWFFAAEQSEPTVENADRRRPVAVMEVQAISNLRTRTFPGIARASREVRLAFRVSGPLRELPVAVGQRVVEGDLIARIDQRDFAVREAQLAAELKNLQAQLVDVRQQYERYRNLYEVRAVPKAEYDHARAAFDGLRARIDATAQQLQAARNALADTELRAPFDGYVHEQYVENFDYVAVKQPVVSLLDCREMEIAVGLPEALIADTVTLTGFRCRFDAYPGRSFSGRLKELARKPQPSNRTYLLTAACANSGEGLIVPGMAGALQVEYECAGVDAQVVIPVEAVVSAAAGTNYVWLFDPGSQLVIRRDVETGGLGTNGMTITHGLAPGELVVVRGAHFLQPGQQVRVIKK